MSQDNQKREMKVITTSDLDIQIESVINLPRKYVFKAYTDPEIIPHWWGSETNQTIVEEMEVKQGGKWRFLQKGSDGNDHIFYGEYKEIIPIEKLSYTFNYDLYPDTNSIETFHFIELNQNKTKIIVQNIFSSKEARDNILKSGWASAFGKSFDKIESLAILNA